MVPQKWVCMLPPQLVSFPGHSHQPWECMHSPPKQQVVHSLPSKTYGTFALDRHYPSVYQQVHVDTALPSPSLQTFTSWTLTKPSLRFRTQQRRWKVKNDKHSKSGQDYSQQLWSCSNRAVMHLKIAFRHVPTLVMCQLLEVGELTTHNWVQTTQIKWVWVLSYMTTKALSTVMWFWSVSWCHTIMTPSIGLHLGGARRASLPESRLPLGTCKHCVRAGNKTSDAPPPQTFQLSTLAPSWQFFEMNPWDGLRMMCVWWALILLASCLLGSFVEMNPCFIGAYNNCSEMLGHKAESQVHKNWRLE